MPHTSNKITVSSLKERLAQFAINLRKAAHRLEPGIEREALVAKAHHTEAASRSTNGCRLGVRDREYRAAFMANTAIVRDAYFGRHLRRVHRAR